MSQKNMGRLAQDMKREVIAIIGRLKDPRLEGGLLTVTRLDVTPDLDVAKVYVSVMGRADGPKPAIEALNRAAGHVRTEVSKKMHIRKAPRFLFVEDDGAAYAAHINELLRERLRRHAGAGNRGLTQPCGKDGSWDDRTTERAADGRAPPCCGQCFDSVPQKPGW